MSFLRNGNTIELEISVVYKDTVKTDPPEGKYKVKNLFVDPSTGKLEVEYEDIPEE